MFDIGFSEIVVIAVVALIVIGPEKLPKTARTLGHLFGRLQRYVNDVKADINREMELDELRKLQQEVQTAAQRLRDLDDLRGAGGRIGRARGRIRAQRRGAAAEMPPAAAPETAPRLTRASRVPPQRAEPPRPTRAAAGRDRHRARGRAAAPGIAARLRPRLTRAPARGRRR